MEVRYERDGDGRTTIVAEVPAETVEEGYRRALRALRRHVSVPGFRPGRVPPKMVESIVGKDKVLELARDFVTELAYPEALQQVPKLVMLDEPDVDLSDIVAGQGCTLTAKALTATVTLGEYKGLAVERFKANATVEEATEALERLHLEEGELTPADHLDVRTGDYVTFSLRIVHNGFLMEEYPEDDPLRIRIGNSPLNPNIDEHLIGLSVDQSSTFLVTYPDDHDSEQLKGQEVEFTAKIEAVEHQESLEEFVARRYPEHPTVEAAAELIRGRLAEYRAERHEAAAREEVVGKAIETAQIDLPQARLQADIMEEIEEFEEELEGEGVDLDGIAAEEMEQHHQRIAERVEYSTRRNILLEAVVDAEKIELDNEALSRRIAYMAAANQVEPRLLLRRLRDEGMLNEVVRATRLEQAADLLFASAQVTEVDPPAEDAAQGDEAVVAVRAADEAPTAADDDLAEDLQVAIEPEDEPCP